MARLNELRDNRRAEFDGFVSRPFALGRDAVAVIIEVCGGLQLPGR
nr:hypothetical protein [Microbacterium testaceum]